MLKEKYYTVAQAAEILGVHAMTIRRWTKEGKLPYTVTEGGHRRFAESDIKKLLRQYLTDYKEILDIPKASILLLKTINYPSKTVDLDIIFSGSNFYISVKDITDENLNELGINSWNNIGQGTMTVGFKTYVRNETFSSPYLNWENYKDKILGLIKSTLTLPAIITIIEHTETKLSHIYLGRIEISDFHIEYVRVGQSEGYSSEWVQINSGERMRVGQIDWDDVIYLIDQEILKAKWKK